MFSVDSFIVFNFCFLIVFMSVEQLIEPTKDNVHKTHYRVKSNRTIVCHNSLDICGSTA